MVGCLSGGAEALFRRREHSQPDDHMLVEEWFTKAQMVFLSNTRNLVTLHHSLPLVKLET